MKYKIVKLKQYSGDAATIYSVILEGEDKTSFDMFIEENIKQFKEELIEISKSLTAIGKRVGAREQFFKFDEGKPGDGVCALYDKEESNLRLYCIRYGCVAVILGGGGYKPKSIRKLSDDPKLDLENEKIKKISQDIMKRLKEDEIEWTADGKELLGNLNFTEDEE